jgi:ribosomal protein S18 acetylase RimI-like enzyme
MEYVEGSRFSVAELTETFNRIYADYFVPMTFTEAQMEAHLRCGGMDLERSVVLVDGGVPAGFSFLAVRGDRGWIGGFGVAPSHRGRGVAYALFAEHVRRIREAGPPRVQLEVFTQNWARKVYEREGFRVTRRLPLLVATPSAGEPLPVVPPADALAHSARLHAAFPASWNREPEYVACALIPGARAAVTGPPHAPTGIAFYTDTPTGKLYVFDAAAESDEAAAALASALGAAAAGRPARLLNEPEGSPVHRALLAAGWTEESAQWEMHWTR